MREFQASTILNLKVAVKSIRIPQSDDEELVEKIKKVGAKKVFNNSPLVHKSI